MPIGIKNRGGATLKLDVVGVSCGCSSVRLGRQTLSPGQSTKLVCTVRAEAESGQFSSTIGLATNDPNKQFVEIVLVGEVEPYLVVEPSSITLQPDLRRRAVVPLRVRNTDDQSISLTVKVSTRVSAEPSASRLDIAPGETEVIDFSCPMDVLEFQQGHVRIGADRADRSLKIPIEINPLQGVEVHPARLMFGMVSKAELCSKRLSILLRGALAESISVDRVEVPPYMRVGELRKGNGRDSVEIPLEILDSVPREPLEDVLELHILLADQPITHAKIIVPFGGVVF